MKIIIAPDSFKGSLTAREAADAIAQGMRTVLPDAQLITVPMADGGEGTVQSLVDATDGRLITTHATGPLGVPVQAQYGLLGDGTTAVIEMAAASGIQFVNAQTRNPLITTTRGTGELILDALDHGVHKLIIGLGGSATNDGGAGMAQALGVRLHDSQGRELVAGGAALAELATIDISGIDPRLAHTEIVLASDVTNPLTGQYGASAVFGPQKGANSAMIHQLDAALHHYAQIIAQQCGRNVEHVPGAGAAGGLGAGFLAFTDAHMRSGVRIVVDTVGLVHKAQNADWCITGEGGIDSQTQYGKTPMGVAQAVHQVNPSCKVVALAGCVSDDSDDLYDLGFDAIFSIVPGVCSLEDAVQHASRNLRATAENIARLIAAAGSASHDA